MAKALELPVEGIEALGKVTETKKPVEQVDNYDKNDEAEPIEDDLDIIAEMIELDSDDLKEE